MTTGKKYDTGKNRYDLVPPEVLEQVVQIWTYGAVKYTDRNWEKGLAWGRLFSAAMRHLWAFWRGEDVDAESKMPHLAHAACNCMMLLHYKTHRREFDDRPTI